jgi:acyl-CoA synthetase (AMP-forming)/AMP-acid ligase II
MLGFEYFERGVARFPNRTIVATDDDAITYAEMSLLVSKLANALVGSGIQPGDRVAILAPNHPMVLTCQYGIVKAGAVWVPSNYRNVPADTARQLNALEVNWLFFHSSLMGHVAAIRQQIPGVRGYVCIDQGASPFAPGLESWVNDYPQGHPMPARQMDDPMAILTTSGTTGTPKGAVHSHRSFEGMIASYYATLRFDEPPVHLVVAPLTHAAGVFHWSLLALGGTHVLAPSADPEVVLQAIERHRVSVLFLPPTVIYMLLSSPGLHKYDYSSLRYFIYGAAPMSVEKLKEAVKAFGPVMTQNFGQSECLQMATILTPQDHAEILSDPAVGHRIAAAGREAPFSRVEIMGEDGALLPIGERGEIVVRASYVMSGYYKNPEGTAEVTRSGWHCTGDVGYKDKDGFVYLVDRKRDMIISGGFNVYPGEVEQVALSHPAVQDCIVVGIPHEKWGEAVFAAVEVKAGQSFDADEFITFCKERIGSVKAPKSVEVWKTLPRSTVGKTLRREVRARLWTGRERVI